MTQANTVFHVKKDPTRDLTDIELSVEAVKVPGGCLFITIHHQWKVMNTVFVKDENIMKQAIPKVDYEKAYKFLTNTEDKDVN